MSRVRDSPRIAVIVPCYRDGEHVAAAVRSIREKEPVDVVIVDDGSDDEPTHEALARLESEGVRVVRHERNRGLAQARSTGLRETRAPYVFPLDSDDLAEPGALAQMADRLDADPTAAVCFGDYAEFGSSALIRAVPDEIDPYRIAYTNEYPVSALFRRSALEDAGGWQDTKDGYEDWYLWMTLAEAGSRGIHLGPGVVSYRRRLHGDRMLASARMVHPRLYERLRDDHPRLFDDLSEHRRGSRLSRPRKLLYPIVYGGRRRFWWEPRVKALLDRLGLWTLRR